MYTQAFAPGLDSLWRVPSQHLQDPEKAGQDPRGACDWLQSRACLVGAGLAGVIRDEASLAAAYGAFAAAAEKEILDATGLDPEDSGPRSKPPRIAEVPVTSLCNGYPAADAQCRLWRHLQTCIEKWAAPLSGVSGVTRSELGGCLVGNPPWSRPAPSLNGLVLWR